ncbi:MAG TPA: PAS domain S-box protein [Holophaga sp.]|nr:PAS domain S-box protein [Holophaga sp.]
MQAWAPFLEALPNGVLLADDQGRVVAANDVASHILRMDRAELLGARIQDGKWTALDTDGATVPPEAFPGMEVLRTGRPVRHRKLGLVGPEGDALWLEISASPLPGGGVAIVLDDVTEHHRTEAILEARARVLDQPGTSLEEVLRATLDEAERLTGSLIGFFHFLLPDQKSLSLQAWSTRTIRDFCRAEGKGSHYELQLAGVWADAARLGVPIIHNDYAHLLERKGLPPGHAEVRRELVVPVLRGGLIVAIVGVGNKPYPYGKADVDAVQRLADLAWERAEHRRTLEALNAQQSAVEQSLSAIALADLDGRLRYINPAGVDLWHLPDRFSCLGRSVNSFWSDPERVGARLAQLITAEAPIQGELEALRQDGSTFLVRACLSLVRDMNGRPESILGTFEDISERKAFEADRDRFKERFEAAFEASPDAILLTNMEDGRYILVNEGFCRLTGLTRQEVQGRNSRELGFWTDLAERDRWMREVMETGRVDGREYHFRSAQGRPVVGLLYSRLIQLSRERVNLTVVRDITALRESQARERRQDRIQVAAYQIAIAALEGHTLGDLCRIVHGHIKDYVPARNFYIAAVDPASGLVGFPFFLDEADPAPPPRPRANSLTDLVLDGGEGLLLDRPRILELQAEGRLTVEGTVPAQWLGVPLKDGDVCYGVMAVQTYTEEVRLAQDELELFRFIGVQISASLARNRAEEMRRKLELEVSHLEKLESLGRLAGGVAHDMNNILAAILAVTQVMRVRIPGGDPLQESVDLVEQAAGRGRDLVKSLVDFSRKEISRPEAIDLNGLVRQEIALLDRTLLKKHEITVDLEPGLPPVHGEPGPLGSAIMNLCFNAVDAMPEGGTLRLVTRRRDPARVELAVEDTGEGMPPEVLKRALEPFYTTKPKGKGTGLGLSQVHNTVRAHGGHLHLESEPGRGTRVVLDLPALVALGPDAAPRGGGPDLGPLEILLVDDEELIRATLPVLLGSLGHRVTAVAGGRQALVRLAGGMRPDLVLLDMNMPEMSGLETLGHLRRDHPALPVLIATGFLEREVEEALARDPAAWPLIKPYTLESFQEAAARLMAGAG